MRPRPTKAKLRHMPDKTTVLQLELEVGSSPIQGTLTGPAGPPQPFTGWIELAGLLERANELERSGTAEPA